MIWPLVYCMHIIIWQAHFLWSSGQGPIFSNLLFTLSAWDPLSTIYTCDRSTYQFVNRLNSGSLLLTLLPGTYIRPCYCIYSYLGHQSKVGMPEEPQYSNYDVLHVLATLEKPIDVLLTDIMYTIIVIVAWLYYSWLVDIRNQFYACTFKRRWQCGQQI